MSPDDLAANRRRALAYADEDPDPVTRDLLRRAVLAEDDAFVRAALEPRLEFGTAGLRGAVGPGPARMNLLGSARFAWALGTFLGQRSLAERGVVLGFDARRDSERFALVIERVLGGLGVACISSASPVPTPVVAFGVRHLGACAGVVVTASHNPASDGGIKLYDDQGLQIVAPWDEEIEALMQAAPHYATMTQTAPGPRRLESDVYPAYLASLRARTTSWPRGRKLRVAYTPIHGVGWATLRAAVQGTGVEVLVVPTQAEPDGDFPTAPFPNPEEAGVLDPLLELARGQRADLALANDPDADRLAVALPDGQGNLVTLSGDEVGLLLADALWDDQRGPPVCVRSVVSSPALDTWARNRGGRVVCTLTGFKWLARAASQEASCLLAYEEALGYCSSAPSGHTAPLDKDGLSAAVELMGRALALGSGEAVLARLAGIAQEIGVWVCHPRSIRLEGAAGRVAATRAMRSLRLEPPRTLGGDPVTSSVDYQLGAEQRSPWLGRQDLLALDTAGGAHILVRPSGTEPKVKIYAHLVGKAHEDSSASYLQRRQELLERAQQLAVELEQRLMDAAHGE